MASAAGVSSWLLLSAGISHSGQVPLHNTSPTWAPPPHLTLNKHPLHYPSLHKTKKGNIYTGFAWDDPPLPVSVFRALISTAGQAQAETCEGEARMPQAAWERQPLSPARLGGGTCRQEAEVSSSISAPPPSSCKREEAAREQGAAGVGKGAEPGATIAQSSLSSFLLFESTTNSQGSVVGESFSPLYSQDSGHAIPPSLRPHG